MARTPTAPPNWSGCSRTAHVAATPGPGVGPLSSSIPPAGRHARCSGAEPETTNNRMELAGVIEGLATLKRPCQVELVTDSQYVAKGISEWLPNWKRQGWQRKEKGQIQAGINVDLWQRLDVCWPTMSPRDTRAGP